MIDRTSFHWLVIDGSELGPDLNGGRLVCINGTGDEPLYEYTIDPTKCTIADTQAPASASPGKGEVDLPPLTPDVSAFTAPVIKAVRAVIAAHQQPQTP